MQVIFEFYLCAVFFYLEVFDVVLHLLVASFEFLYFCLEFTGQVFEVVIVLLLLPEFVDEVELLLLHVLVAVEQRVFELFGHDLHFLAGALHFFHLLLQLVEELLVTRADFLNLNLQHLLLATAILPFPFVVHQLLLVVADLFSQAVVLLQQPRLLTLHRRMHL